MKTVAVIQARFDSSRLPGKVLKELGGKAVLQWSVDAARAIPGVQDVVVATSEESNDDPIAEYCVQNKINLFRGSKNNVLQRVILAAEQYKADAVMRITADCPFLDPDVCAAVLQLFKRTGCDYASNVEPPSWPDGLDCEVVSLRALKEADKKAYLDSQREHVTAYIQDNKYRFPSENLLCPVPGLSAERWTLDNGGDYKFMQAIAGKLGAGVPRYTQILDVLENNPEIYKLKSAEKRDAGYEKSLQAEEYVSVGYENSGRLLKQALKTIPLASQTFSKSSIQFPQGAAPSFLTHGRGGRAWDVDGNMYVDMISALLPNVLGYCDPDVDAAVRRQLQRGISFSMATDLEMKVAEKLVKHVPCAEMVRFGKNGTDATSAAIRLSRAYTGREHLIVCGYHGWQDWYIGSTTRHLGVPEGVRALTHTAPYNDLKALEELFAKHKGKIAALIMEPVNVEAPKDGYLQAVKDLVHEHGAVLVFDEVITGFRYHLGGAQGYYGVAPDLAAFGKAMGNGMPISAIVGCEKIMRKMEDIFFSGTFGGEALSLAASLAVIEKMESEPVVAHLWNYGAALAEDFKGIVQKNKLEGVFGLLGLSPWHILSIGAHETAEADAIRTQFLTDMLSQGVLIGGSHNVCYAHNAEDRARMRRAYEYTLGHIAELLSAGTLTKELKSPIIRSIFQLRQTKKAA